MSYRLDAAISDFDRMRRWAHGVTGAVVAPLAQRLGLLPVTTELRGDLPRLLRDLSRGGPVAHGAADIWGGDGDQTARPVAGRRTGMGPGAHLGLQRSSGGPADQRGARPARRGAGRPRRAGPPRSVRGSRPRPGRDEEEWRRAALEAYDAADYDTWHAGEQARREAGERAAAERAAHERLPGVPVPLDGKEIIALLGIPQGRTVGAAIRHLQQLHIDHGPVSREEAEAALRTWAAERGVSARPR
ncbi:hypothetical protein P9869_28210 [Streptomyces ossamyceticus]|nr:hypothetical protein [Streptomyces ossamyceticus]